MPPKVSPPDKPEDTLSRDSYSRLRNIFSVPRPIKTLFESVPVITYAPNDLPQRSPKQSRLPTLYVFGSEEDVKFGRPSFNPSCLRWQTFLKIAGVNHRLCSSNNHASPTGVLPFLMPAISSPNAGSQASSTPLPIASNKLLRYAQEHGSQISEPTSIRYEAYQSLLDVRIRAAWLYTLYLSQANSSIPTRLYTNPATSSVLVRKALIHQLHSAAEAELLKTNPKIDVDDLYAEADKAFDALSVLLGDGDWFFSSGEGASPGAEESSDPTLFDASVFAYTHLLLDEKMGWKDKRLVRAVRKRANLVAHRERLLNRYWGEAS